MGQFNLRLAAVAIASMVLLVDQMTKWALTTYVMNPPRLIEVTPFFNVTMWFNRGVTFGFLASDEELVRWLIVALTLAIVAILSVWAYLAKRPVEVAALGAIIGGALGNITDRVRHGGVVDFLDFHAFGWHWPAFNIADAAIVCGTFALILNTSLHKPQTVDPNATGREMRSE